MANEGKTVGQGDHEVVPGEGLSLIAWTHGFFWETLWKHPANRELREARRNPEVLLPGDRITIPERSPKAVSCRTGQKHVFRRRGVPSRVSFQVKIRGGTVFAGKRFVLEAGEQRLEGTTSPEGRIEQWVSPALKEVTLTVWLDEAGFPEQVTWVLRVGHLEPVETLRGVQSRLVSLGYVLEGEAGAPGPKTASAIRDVQVRSGLEPTGEIDGDTRSALLALHGS